MRLRWFFHHILPVRWKLKVALMISKGMVQESIHAKLRVSAILVYGVGGKWLEWRGGIIF